MKIVICAVKRGCSGRKGIRFAPLEVAVYFGREHGILKMKGIEPFLVSSVARSEFVVSEICKYSGKQCRN